MGDIEERITVCRDCHEEVEYGSFGYEHVGASCGSEVNNPKVVLRG